jgi:N-acetylneuraminic acid mutarotase
MEIRRFLISTSFMQNSTKLRAAACSAILVTILLSGAACNKESVVPVEARRQGPVATGLTVGLPPKIIFWAKGPDVPVEADLASTLIGRESPFSFSIGGKGYIGAGIVMTNNSQGQIEVPGTDTWQYDTVTRAWTQVASWPGSAHTHMGSFTLDTTGYVCTGSTFPDFGNPQEIVKEVWLYNQATNSWTRKGDFPGAARSGPVAAAMNGKGYLGTGSTSANAATRDWWKYNPAGDTWTQKTSLPGPRRTEASAFAPPVANGRIYVCAGYQEQSSGTDYYNDLWEYNPATDSWIQRTSMPAAGRGAALGMSLPTEGVIATGTAGFTALTSFNDCWLYNPATGNWGQLPNVGGGVRYNAGGFAMGNSLFIGAGQNSGLITGAKTDFWGLSL